MSGASFRMCVGAERRTWWGWFEDGLWDIATGVLLLGWVLRRVVVASKARLVDPRTGYLRFRDSSGWSVSTSIDAGLAIASVAILLVLLLDDAAAGLSASWNAIDPLVALMVAFVSCLCSFLAWHTRLARYVTMAAAAPLAAVLAGLAGLDGFGTLYVVAAAEGVLFLVAGAFALRAFLRRHPLPDGE